MKIVLTILFSLVVSIQNSNAQIENELDKMKEDYFRKLRNKEIVYNLL